MRQPPDWFNRSRGCPAGRRVCQDIRAGGASGDPWDDFIARPADYFALLSELGLITEDEEKAHGDLAEDIVRAVRAGTQDGVPVGFVARLSGAGARFAPVQRKVIIGDEMGLGKTVEAIAVLAHLRAIGSHRSW